MSSKTRIVCVVAALLVSCGGPQQPEPAPGPPKKSGDRPAPVIAAPRTDVRGEIIATISGTSLDALLAVVSGYILPAAPPAVQPMVQPDALKAHLFKQLQLESVAPALDTARPFAVAFADPMAYRQGQVGSAMIALPLKDAPALCDFLGRLASRHEITPWQDHVFDINGNALLVRLDKSWAYLASHDRLLHGASRALAPLLEKNRSGTLQLSVDMAAVEARYGAQIDGAVDALSALAGKSPGLAAVQSTLRRWLSYLKGMRGLDLSLDLQPQSIKATFAARSLGQGAFQKFLDELAVGEPWGAKFVPADSAVLLLNRTRPESRLEMLDDSLKMLKATLGDAITEARLKKLRDAMAAASGQLGAESATGVWVSADGGLGFGGAVAVKDAAAAQKELARSMRVVSQELGLLLQKMLAAAGQETLKGLRLSIGVRAGALPVGGLRADLYELNVGWPRPREKEAREKIAEVKKAAAKLLGPRPTLAFAASGGVGVLAFGKDYRKRMAELCAIARGGPGTTQEKVARELSGGRQLTTLFHVPLASVVEGALRVADQLTTVRTDVRNAINSAMPGPGRSIPMTASIRRDGGSLLVELEVSPDLILLVAKGLLISAPVSAP